MRHAQAHALKSLASSKNPVKVCPCLVGPEASSVKIEYI